MGRKRTSRVLEEEEECLPDEETEGGCEDPVAREKSLYEVLGAEKTASQQEIKKAYYKLALRLHPDKNPGDEEAKENFQLLQKVMSVLGDEEKRALYDQTGFVDDVLFGEAVVNLQDFFRTMYRKVTEADIEGFEANYRGSDSEKKDLKELYAKCKGNMNRLFCSMLCSEPKLDSHRFEVIIDEAIAEGELKPTKAYLKWARQISKMKSPINPLVKRGKSKGQSDTDLVSVIAQRRSQRKEQFNSFLSSIVAKYDKKAAPEPTEEEFARAQQRLESRKRNNRQT